MSENRTTQPFSISELREAFVHGFSQSGEGWNGEYPFDENYAEIDNALDGAFKEFAQMILDRSSRD